MVLLWRSSPLPPLRPLTQASHHGERGGEAKAPRADRKVGRHEGGEQQESHIDV